MAFPIVEEVLTQQIPSPLVSGEYDINMPTTVNSGELLIILLTKNVVDAFNTVSGWTLFFESSHSTGRFAIYSKVANGSEGGTTVTISHGGEQQGACAQVFRISEVSGNIEIGAGVTVTDSTVNLPAVTASWGAKDNLFIAVLGMGDDEGTLASTDGNYGNIVNITSGNGENLSSSTASARRELNSASDDPGVFTLSEIEAVIGNTLVIEPTDVPTDSVAPTVGTPAITATATNNSVTASFAKATDDVSAQSALVYKLYTSLTNNLTTDPATVIANGTLQDTQTDVTSLTATGLNSGTLYYMNVVVEDEAGNQAIYTSNSATTSYVYGTVSDGGTPVNGATVLITSVADFDFASPTHVEQVQTDASGNFAMTATYNGALNYLVTPWWFESLHSGTADSATANTLTDAAATWTAGAIDDGTYVVRTIAGTGSGQERIIASSTADTLTLVADWGTSIDGSTDYEIGQIKTDQPQIYPATS